MSTQNLNAQFIKFPIQDSDIQPPTSAQNLSASKMQYGFKYPCSFGLAVDATPVTKRFWLFTADGAGLINGFHASVLTSGSSASVTVDLEKDGVSVLSAPITLTDASVDGGTYDATISVPSFVDGSRYTALLTVSSSTGMAGVSCWVNGYEQVLPA